MSVRTFARRLPTIGVCVLLCLVMFDVPSAYAIARGAPWWLALAVGLVVFPLAPVAWHIVSERRRARAEKPKTAKPPATKGIERFVLRTVVIAVVAIGGLIVVARGRVWTAFRANALWFIPTSVDPLEPTSALLDRVPPSAQVVLWVRPTADANAVVGKLMPGTTVTEIVIAEEKRGTATEGMVIERGDLIIPLIERIQSMTLAFTAKQGIAVPEKGSIVSDTGGVKTWSTSGWVREIGTKRAPVLELMRRAPEDAFLVVVGNIPPRTPDPKTTPETDVVDEMVNAGGLRAVMWARAPSHRLELDATIETPDVATATRLLEEGNRAFAQLATKHAKEVGCWKAHTDELSFRRDGANLRARVSVDVDELKPLLVCLER